ncbi:MAG: protein kinase [Chitinophagaceae bacterium]|nr:protein kinase [Chitinophagaceae bacterium]
MMDYCSQGPLNHLMGQLSIGQRLYAIRCVARGLSVLHKHLVAHRDLKPANVFVDEAGICQIGDFGMAKVMSESSGMTKSANVGTVLFMSPEAARGECAGMEWLKSDMWSFGMLCYNSHQCTPYEATRKRLAASHFQYEAAECAQQHSQGSASRSGGYGEAVPASESFCSSHCSGRHQDPQSSSQVADSKVIPFSLSSHLLLSPIFYLLSQAPSSFHESNLFSLGVFS